MTISIQATDLTCRFGSVQAVDNATFSVAKGDFVAVEGPSGSGKSTLLNLIGGLEAPLSGRVEVAGTELSTLSERDRTTFRRTNIGMIFQLYDLLPTLNAWQNVAVPALLGGAKLKDLRDASTDLLKQVGLEDRATHIPAELSGGEQQRVAIARSLMNDPQIILADEPTGALDSVTGDEILGLLQSLCEDGRTVVMVTHAARAAAYASRSLRMLDGSVTEPALS